MTRSGVGHECGMGDSVALPHNRPTGRSGNRARGVFAVTCQLGAAMIAMSGIELIAWAVGECDKKALPPTDANILMFIREWGLR